MTFYHVTPFALVSIPVRILLRRILTGTEALLFVIRAFSLEDGRDFSPLDKTSRDK